MKKQKRLIMWIVGLFLMLFSVSAMAQPVYTCDLRSRTQPSCNTFEFDIFLKAAVAGQFQMAQVQFGIFMNPALVNGGTITVTPVANSSTLTNAAQVPGPEKFSYDAVNNLIKLTPVAPPGIGNGSVILSTGNGTKYIRVRVMNSVPWPAEATNLAWNFASVPLYPTKVFAYTGGLNTDITATGTFTTNFITNNGTALLTNLAAPVAQTVTGDGGTYCNLPVIPPAVQGAPVGLAASANGVAYELYRDGISTGQIIYGRTAGVGGAGSGISFGNQTEGFYQVKAFVCGSGFFPTTATILPPTEPEVASVTITTDIPGNILPDPGVTVVTFTANPDAFSAGTIVLYEWFLNGDYQTDGPEFIWTPNDGDVIGLNMNAEAGACVAPAIVSDEMTMSGGGVLPAQYNVTGGGSYCQGSPNTIPIGLSDAEVGVTYELFEIGNLVTPVATAIPAVIGPFNFTGTFAPGNYIAKGTNVTGTSSMNGSAVVTETPSSTVEFTVSECDTYTWALNGVTYTVSGNYTYVVGCVTNILHLTITPSSTVEFTVSECDSYTWALNGVTYTASGNYTYVVGCVTNILHLTITPSSTVEFTVSECDSYTWALNGVTYTASGNYTYVVGCVTNILHLTITPSGTTEYTESACDSYLWPVNGVTYTVSGDYTYVSGCGTSILHLTITPSSTVEFTQSACDTYTWALNGMTYTSSGNYTYVVGCVTNILHLTITPTVTPTFAQLGPYVQGAVPAALPGMSIEGVSGTWNPATISTAAVGSITYNFTPTAGQCATTASMIVVVNAPAIPTTSDWTGLGLANDWNDAANWNNGVPGAITAVKIKKVANTNYPTLTVGKTVKSFVIEDEASFIGAENLTITDNGGKASIKRNLTNALSHFMSSPVAGETAAGVPVPNTTTWIRGYNNPAAGAATWTYLTGTQPWVLGMGYSVSTTTPTVICSFDGVMNSAPVTKSGLSINNLGWNLLGNPFQSAIDWDLLTPTGLSGTVKVWSGSTYVSWNGTTGALANGLIPAEGGFFVQALAPGASLAMPLSARTHGSYVLYKASVSDVLRVDVKGNDLEDATFIHFNNDATEAFDHQYDGEKLFGSENCPQVYSIISDRRLDINELPMEGNEVVDLGFKCNTTGEYTLNASSIETFDATTPIILEDLMLSTTQDLRSNPVYSFSYVNGDKENRFRLHFKSSTGIGDLSNGGIGIYSLEKSVVITNATQLAGEVWIYDVAGRELIHSSMNSQGKTTIPVNAAIGVYMVKVVTAKGSVNQKVFIR